ncbi:hypothetical protein A0J57_08695 [Sphingobium sp. 22B]|nr:hypothetical protein AXW74_06190 [Sphingobium sp. AM]KYC32786.1 hypothetical protein A0J57_08695 [Sphingobium sp. 22B]
MKARRPFRHGRGGHCPRRPRRSLIWVIPFAVAGSKQGPHSGCMDEKTTNLIMAILSRAPQWIRHDLLSKDAGVKQRAEETLAAMIANALATGTDDSTAS